MITAVSNPPAPASTSLPAKLEDIRDIKPPVEIPSGWEWLWWVGAGIAILALVWVLWRYFRKRKSLAKVVMVIPPHERARRKLAEALELYDQPKPFCILVSGVVRLYLEERFGLRAPERTTEEFLNDLSRSSALHESQKASLQEFLSACDMVKFARYEPQRPELEALYNSALRLIEETTPRGQPGSPPLKEAEAVTK